MEQGIDYGLRNPKIDTARAEPANKNRPTVDISESEQDHQVVTVLQLV